MSWESFLLPWIALYAAVWLALLAVPSRWSRALSWFPLVGGLLLLSLQFSSSPGQKLLAGSAFLLVMVKGTVLLATPRPGGAAWLIPYLTFWPGIALEPFRRRTEASEQDVQEFSPGWWRLWAGLVAFLAVATFGVSLHPWLIGLLAVVALILGIHFGASHVLVCSMRLLGFPVPGLFDRPLISRRLSEFWSVRWNRPFVDMNRLLVMPWATRILGRRAWMAGFLASGLLHEIAISYPAGAGFGLPTLYFLLQAGLILFERRLRIRSRLWTLAAILVPAPILFHPPFLQRVVAPLAVSAGSIVRESLQAVPLEAAVMTLGILTLLPLLASLQVPRQLRWREELPRLSSLNAKLMWVYGGFIAGMILGLGVFLVVFARQVSEGSPVALAVLGFGAAFWTARLLIDAIVFKPGDWPAGPLVRVGRTLLDTLFVTLTLGYWAIFVWSFVDG